MPLSMVVTVIDAVPSVVVPAVTRPVALTEAIPGLLLDQVTALLVALAGDTTAVSCWVCP